MHIAMEHEPINMSETNNPESITPEQLEEFEQLRSKVNEFSEQDTTKYMEMFVAAIELKKVVEEKYGPAQDYLLFHLTAGSTPDLEVRHHKILYYDTPNSDIKHFLTHYIEIDNENR